jgi:hypothetical protein
VVLIAVGATSTVNAQTDLQARLALRPLTTGDLTAYKLPTGTQLSPGLTTVAIGAPAYLEAQVNIALAPSDITGVTWTLNTKPNGSTAGIVESPLGKNVPVYEPSDRLVTQAAGRALLRPDVNGVYSVSATITTRTGAPVTVAQTIVAASYVGIQACARCHSGGLAAPMTASWSKTAHAEIFKDELTGAAGNTSYASTCFGCHTVGYDLNNTADSGGFDKVAAKLGWTPPATSVPANWDNLPDALKNVANIQCENCHGPGSEHAKSGGTPYAISKAKDTGTCGVCHDAPTHHIKIGEWNNSVHAVTTRDPSGAGRETCVGCHTANGFIGRMTGAKTVDTTFAAINCQTCHEPHGQTNPSSAAHLVRTRTPVTLADGTKISNAGEGALCMSCHQSRQNAQVYATTTAGSSHYGPHDGPQADMLEGANGFTYGKFIPSSAHAFVAKDTCVACHMQATATTDAAFLNAGGHTFKMGFTPTGSDKPVQLVAACQGCHGPEVTTFNFRLFDYNEDDKIEGVQDEVQGLLDQLSTMLPPVGQPKTALNIDATWTRPQLQAAYNWLFVNNDGSKGVHNTAYAVGLLKASIDDLNAKK